jgi:hypothetical protein
MWYLAKSYNATLKRWYLSLNNFKSQTSKLLPQDNERTRPYTVPTRFKTPLPSCFFWGGGGYENGKKYEVKNLLQKSKFDYNANVISNMAAFSNLQI